jgi:hypothetical protein
MTYSTVVYRARRTRVSVVLEVSRVAEVAAVMAQSAANWIAYLRHCRSRAA